MLARGVGAVFARLELSAPAAPGPGQLLAVVAMLVVRALAAQRLVASLRLGAVAARAGVLRRPSGALGRAASQTMGVMSMAADFGEELKGVVTSDASAAHALRKWAATEL